MLSQNQVLLQKDLDYSKRSKDLLKKPSDNYYRILLLNYMNKWPNILAFIIIIIIIIIIIKVLQICAVRGRETE